MRGFRSSHPSTNRVNAVPRVFVGMTQFSLMIGLLGLLIFVGFLLFRRPVLERYFEKKTGYECQIEGFDLDLRDASIELSGIEIFNVAPFPRIPLGKIRRARLEWETIETGSFPKLLNLLDIEIESITVIRLDGNEFNFYGFVEALVQAWGQSSGGTPLQIKACSLRVDSLIAIDEEREEEKKLIVQMDYFWEGENIASVREITDPAMEIAKEEVDRFYLVNYVKDGIKGFFRK